MTAPLFMAHRPYSSIRGSVCTAEYNKNVSQRAWLIFLRNKFTIRAYGLARAGIGAPQTERERSQSRTEKPPKVRRAALPRWPQSFPTGASFGVAGPRRNQP